MREILDGKTAGRRVLVVGLGISGEAAARLLLAEGARVTVVDASALDRVRAGAESLRERGVLVLTGAHELPSGDYDFAVLSPGFEAGHAWLRELAARRIPTISELDLGASRCRCPLLAVTGSKGKSSLVTLCADALVAGGRRAATAGNIGRALCDAAAESASLDWLVVEVSSFQLEHSRHFNPRVALLLNVQPDHLDRHGSLEEYAAVKVSLFVRQSREDTAILPVEELALVDRLLPERRARVLTFGADPAAEYRYEPGRVVCAAGVVPLAGTRFDNPVLGSAAAAAAAACAACGVDPAAVGPAAAAFVPLPHRFETVATLDGVRFIDDSKATSLAATAAALHMAGGPVRLIAGGLLKEHDLDGIKELLALKTRCVYGVGKASDCMAEAWGATVPFRKCGTLDVAVRMAAQEAQAGETVLLSPGCASFDQYRNFEARGDHFKALVGELIKGGG